MKIVNISEIKKCRITDFFMKQWGSPEMVISSGTFQCDELDGFVALDEGDNIIGLITYIILKDECEIISLDSLVENKGIGTKLVQKVEEAAANTKCKRIKLVTTNDNLHALAFYQKRGYSLADLFINAVDKARKVKPEIPLIAENGIPIRDEILLDKAL